MRRFELVDGSSRKFWQTERDGSNLAIQWGKIGTVGQRQVKELGSEARAQAEHDKLVAEKLKKGYVEVAAMPGEVASPAIPATKAAAPLVKATATKATATKATAAKATAAKANANANAKAPVATAEPKAPDAPAEAPPPAAAPGAPAITIDRSGLDARDVDTPHRRGVLRPCDDDLAADPWRAVQAAWARWSPCYRWDDLVIPAELAPSIHDARAWLEGSGPAPLAPLTAASVAILVDVPWGGVGYPLVRALAEPSVAKDGPDWLIDAVLAATRVEIDPPASQLRNKQAVAVRAFVHHPDSVGPFERASRSVTRFAFFTQNLPEDAYAAVRAAVSTRWPTLSYFQKQLVLGLIPDDTPLADALGEEWLACDGHVEGHVPTAWSKEGVPPELRFACSRPVLVKLAKKAAARSSWVGHLGQALWTQLDLCGADVVPLARIYCDSAGHSDHVRGGLRVAAAVRGPETATLMVAHLASKRDAALIAETWLGANPALAIPALADVTAAASTLADRAASVLLELDRAHPGLADGLEVRPAARAALHKLRARMAPRPTATADELPRVLVEPPWSSSIRPPALPVVPGVAMLDYPEALHDAIRGDDDRDGDDDDDDAAAADTDDDIGVLSQVREERAHARDDAPMSFDEASAQVGVFWHGGYVSKHLNALSDADVRRAFAEWPADAWAAGHHLLVPLVVLGVEAIGGYPRIAARQVAPFAAALADVVESPRLAPFFAHARTLKAARKSAERWFRTFPKAATIGLIPAAVGPHGQPRDQAEAALRFIAGDHGELVGEVAASYGAEVAAAVTATLAVDPRDRLPAKLPKLPAWCNVDVLPALLLAGGHKALPRSAVEALFVMLAISTPETVYGGIEDVVQTCDRASLAGFSWALFHEWQRAGAPAKEAWGMHQLGLFGDDEVARKLTPLIRAWPGENLQARAVVGLEILTRIGSDLALMHLHGIAQKVKFKGLQEKARAKMDEIAQNRGLSADQLADRLVPDLDLDPDGSRTLDLGPRQFRVGFDEALKPFVVDGAGKVLGDLPRPNKADDAAKAKAADATWKALKKDVKAIASNQITRLELAMCAERRWEVGSFRALFLDHPLLVHLVRRLIWGVYADDGTYLRAFRVAEDSSLADADDAAWTLPERGLVGVVHPLTLSDAERAAFGQTLGDYGIVQPFPQLGRDTYAPTEAERTASSIDRRDRQVVPVGKLLGLVERGWRKGHPQDAGWIWELRKPLPGKRRATLELRTGIGADLHDVEPRQEIGTIWVSRKGDGVELGALAPVVFSELIRDLVQLGSAT